MSEEYSEHGFPLPTRDSMKKELHDRTGKDKKSQIHKTQANSKYQALAGAAMSSDDNAR
tara:strand:- start:2 stop:178 length:177 start_codon:yes stop_codon:yes gene_type:complete